jgi:hypothetical protein
VHSGLSESVTFRLCCFGSHGRNPSHTVAQFPHTDIHMNGTEGQQVQTSAAGAVVKILKYAKPVGK